MDSPLELKSQLMLVKMMGFIRLLDCLALLSLNVVVIVIEMVVVIVVIRHEFIIL